MKRYYFIVYNSEDNYYTDYVDAVNLELAKDRIQLKNPNAYKFELYYETI